MFYSTQIFEAAGISGIYAQISTAGVSFTFLIFTVISMLFIEKLGRKVILIISEIFSFLPLLVLSVTFILTYYGIAPQVMSIISAVCIMLFIAGFAIGLGPIPWVILGEVYPTDVSGVYSSIITAINMIYTLAVALLFESFDNLVRPFTFIPFAVALFICTVLSFIFVYETKGKSIEEITKGI
jgi:MFS transporter, SP family, galactose:H+ symporter